MGVFPQRNIPHPVPAVLDRPTLADGFEHGLGTSAQTLDVVTGLVLRLALAGAMVAHSGNRRAARLLLHHLLRCRHGPDGPGDVTAPFDFPLGGAPGDPPDVGEPIADQPKSFRPGV